MTQFKTPLKQGTAVPLPAYLKLQRLFLAVCIALAPLSVILYSVSWARSPNPTNIATVGASAIISPALTTTCATQGTVGG